MKQKTCCVTGHRKIPSEKLTFVKRELRREIEQAIADGYTRFISGFAEGADTIFAEIVIEKRKHDQRIRLEAAIPYRRRCINLMDRGNDHPIWGCTEIHILNEAYNPTVYFERNRYLVDCADRLLAVFNGRKQGGTWYTMNYACIQEKEIRQIWIGESEFPDQEYRA